MVVLPGLSYIIIQEASNNFNCLSVSQKDARFSPAKDLPPGSTVVSGASHLINRAGNAKENRKLRCDSPWVRMAWRAEP